MRPRWHRDGCRTGLRVCLAVWMWLTVCVPASAPGADPSTPSQELPGTISAADLDGILFEKTVYFSSPAGYLSARAGLYLTRATDEHQILLIPNQGGPPLLLQAARLTEQPAVSSPTAFTLSDVDDVFHVVLILPGGIGLEASGALSPVRLRGAPPRNLNHTEIEEALLRKERGTRLAP